MFQIFLLISLYSSIQCFPAGYEGASTIILTPFNNANEITHQKIIQAVNSKTFTYGEPFPDSGRKKAILEQESPLSKKDSAYGNLQQFVASFYNPKPVVDTIQEHEKYGNDGDKFRSVGVAVVGGIEAFSNLLNAAVEAPFEAAKQIGKKISTTLNMVGGKLVGLA